MRSSTIIPLSRVPQESIFNCDKGGEKSGDQSLMNRLPLPLLELIQEYRGGIRVKVGKMELNTFEGKQVFSSVTINAGIWFVRHLPPCYDPGITRLITVIRHYTYNIPNKASIVYDGKEQTADSLILSSGNIHLCCFPQEADTEIMPPIINPNYILIYRITRGRFEEKAMELASHYCYSMLQSFVLPALRSVIPPAAIYQCKVSGTLTITLHNINWKKAFPRLKKYGKAHHLTIEYRAPADILLSREKGMDITLRPNDLYGGTAAEGMRRIFMPVERHPRFLAIYQALMREMTKEGRVRIIDIEDRNGEVWIIEDKNAEDHDRKLDLTVL